jgi:hypothetical protein
MMQETEQKVEKKSRIQELIDSINQIRSEEYDPKEFLVNSYGMWLQAVQNGEKKVHLLKISVDPTEEQIKSTPIWDENSSFEEWLSASKELIVELRLPDTKKKLSEGYSADNPSPFQLQLMALRSEIKFEDPMEMEKLDKVYYEYVEWDLSKQKEAIEAFLGGRITLTEKDFLKYMIDKEVGNIVMSTADSLMGRLQGKLREESLPMITDRKQSVVEKIKKVDAGNSKIPIYNRDING